MQPSGYATNHCCTMAAVEVDMVVAAVVVVMAGRLMSHR
jgi:hypothetical protein